MKDKPISEDELLDELDTMYQRVADIEKEEAAEAPPTLKTKPKSIQKKKRPYRTIIIMAFVFFVVLAFIFAMTIFDPMALLQRLKTGVTHPPTVATPPPVPSKRPAAVPPPAPAKPPSVATSQEPPKPPVVDTTPAPPSSPSVAPSPAASSKLPSGSSPPVQPKPEAAKSAPEETKKTTTKPPEIAKADKPALRGRYYAIQIGSFRDMENVRELVEAFKKEGLDAYWITMKGGSRGTLYRVLVGQFKDEMEAAQFLKDKQILKNHPDSFIKEVSSSKISRY